MTPALLFSGTLFLLTTLSCKTSPSQLDSGPRRTNFSPGDLRVFNPAHFEGPFTVEGDWDLDPAAIKAHYADLNVARFGTLSLILPSGAPLISRSTREKKYIRDLHYMLGNDRVGIRPIPIVDRKGTPASSDPDYPQPKSVYWQDYPPAGKTADGTKVLGSELLDQVLRKEYGFRPEDTAAPLFALYGLTHPEIFELPFSMLGDMDLTKAENGMTHLGAYIGQGQTRNSPASYGSLRWEILKQARRKPLARPNVSGYPANIYIVRPKWPGVDTRTFLHNILITLRLLNELNDGPDFPLDYKFDWIQTVNLEETLAFYRAWIDPEWKRHPQDAQPYLAKIKADKLFQSYCAEHLTIVLNVAINLAQNEQGYIDVWGPKEGPKLWQLAKSRYEQRERLINNGQDVFFSQKLGANANSAIPLIANSQFVPLWKARGLKQPAREATPGRALAYPLVTNADLIAAMLEQYANWADVGPVLSIAALFSFMPETIKRTGITAEKYLEFASRFATQMIKHDASAQPFGKSTNISQAYTDYLQGIENGDPLTQSPGLRQVLKDLGMTGPGTADKLLSTIMDPLRSKQMANWIKNNHDKDINKEAWRDFQLEVSADMQAARAIEPALPEGTVIEKPNDSGELTTAKNVKYYTPPAVIHRIAAGWYPYADDYLEIKAVATAMDASELRKASGPYRQYKVAP